MRTNIEIDDDLMSDALAAGPFKTKKEAVEAGLTLLKRQAAMRELLKMGGTVSWGWGDEDRLDGKSNWSRAAPAPAAMAAEPQAAYKVTPKSDKAKAAPSKSGAKPRARR